ncbi:toxin-activating lysine-acyltransferase [Azospirillum picis]|uniref:RTX toxin-activating lysine-acyltransferase n=1 Tax=Azospirillum picis TaxID=488438 RepID=A0ABU0MN99_9PROT|nr:toxin-activating lysine-acyltransferase [Azospirillum picis]MBP2303552.1 cytolysin-activating lysine-acyltransferase [Azospirillum picis]MDQ0534942.1 cytolysin-activating lysine-acyltransferase [Azospirillum picis]
MSANIEGIRSPSSETPTSVAQVTLATVFGEAAWLLTQSPRHKHLFLSDLEWMVMPPFLLQQFRTFRSGERLVGLALWASVSEEVVKRLEAGSTKLAPTDWKSGDRLWLVELVTPFGQQEAMVEDLKVNGLPGWSFKMLTIDAQGKKAVTIVARE